MSATIPQLADHAVVAVSPGDQDAADTVQAWLQDYATSHDPRLRERIILAYVGLADRLAGRFRDSRGTTPEDLRQAARAARLFSTDARVCPRALLWWGAGWPARFAQVRHRGDLGCLLLMLPVHPALVDDQSNEVPGDHHHPLAWRPYGR